MLKKMLLVFFSVAMIVGCADKDEQSFKIGVSNNFVSSEFRTQMIDGLIAINQKYMDKGITSELVIENADTDIQGQIQQIRNLINKGVDAIVVDPGSESGLNQVFKEAAAAGIVIVATDQAVSAPEVINVVIDQNQWAKISAEWLATQLNGKGRVIVMNGIAGHPASETRFDGVKEVFAQYPDINIINVVNANWDQATGQQRMADLLASIPNIDGVWVQDGMAEGVLRAVSLSNPKKWPVLVGEARGGYIHLWKDVLDTNPSFISYGVINPPGSAVSAYEIAIRLLQGKKLREDVLVSGNTLYVPVPGVVDSTNFATIYEEVKDKPGSFVLDGFIDDETADSYFQ